MNKASVIVGNLSTRIEVSGAASLQTEVVSSVCLRVLYPISLSLTASMFPEA
jgi:hypothetical protein